MDDYNLRIELHQIKLLFEQLVTRFKRAEQSLEQARQLPCANKDRISTFMTSEEVLCQGMVSYAVAAFNYWATFMALAGGPLNNRSLSAAEVSRWMCIVRAVSFC